MAASVRARVRCSRFTNAIRRDLEWEPVDFLGRRGHDLLADSRATLAAYLGVDADEVAYFPNPTTALNMVARSLCRGLDIGGAPANLPALAAPLKPGDEILTTDHEYGALDRTWRFVCRKTGASYIRRPMPLPVGSPSDFVENFWAGVTERTRIVYLSHISSPTALIFPAQEICRRAREAGILSVVDGAHAVSQVPLDLRALGVDIYSGACHKWLCAPKGTAFVYVRRELQPDMEPLVVSWGWENESPGNSIFIDQQEWQGTRDISAFLSVPAAIDFQSQNNWPEVRARCHALASATRNRINALTGLDPICPDSPEWFGQMVTARLPEIDRDALRRSLLEDYHIEVPISGYAGQPLIRVSFQAYNTQSDADALVAALATLLRRSNGRTG